MFISSRTPEGQPNKCPICGHQLRLEPSLQRDGTCPRCSCLMWFSESQSLSKGSIEELGQSLVMFQKCVQLVPSNVTYRQLLRSVECLLFDQGALSDNKLRLQRIRRRVEQEMKNENWARVGIEAEKGLAINPRDVDLNIALGGAMIELGRKEIARFAYFSALKEVPSRMDLREKVIALNPLSGDT